MTNEELERTGVLKAILDKDTENEDTTIGERIEEFEDKLEYIDIADDIKEKELASTSEGQIINF